MAAISVTEAAAGFIPLGESRSSSVAGLVSTVAAGLSVNVTAASRLICNIGTYDHDGDSSLTDVDAVGETPARTAPVPIGGVPVLKVTEGFNGAWESMVAGFAQTDEIGAETWVVIELVGLPSGVTVTWPPLVTGQMVDGEATGTLTLHTADVTSQIAAAISTARYSFGDGVGNAAAEFTIELTVNIPDESKVGTGGLATATAKLAPGPNADATDLDSRLSYRHPGTAAMDIVNVTECVTYLLFPYITCGAHDDWDTGIAIANTTMDDGIFGVSPGAGAQSGSVTLWAYPTSEKAADGMTGEGYMAEAAPVILSPSLAAGDSVSVTCSAVTGLAGMQGYAIAKTGFRHAHGMAFVMNTASGAVDAVHGYIALVIPDPEFGGQRAPAGGETLGH